MGRPSENPMYNVVSCRITDEEKDNIQDAVGKESISAFLRKALLKELARMKKEKL